MALSQQVFQSYSPNGQLKPFSGKITRDSKGNLGSRPARGDTGSWYPGTRWLSLNDEGLDERLPDHIGLLIPAEQMLSREQLYASALTPKGRYITWVAIRNAFRQGWKFVEELKKRKPLPPRLHQRLVDLTNKYDLKIWFAVAKSCAAIFGRSLMFVRQVNPVGMLPHYEIRVTPLWETYIKRDNDGNRIGYNPIIRVGNGLQQFDIPLDEAVLWVNTPDLFGNAEEGYMEHLAVFRTIKRSESIANNFAELVSQKGLGQLHITIPDIVDRSDALKWAEAYKTMINDSVVVTSPEMLMSVEAGISAGYDYNNTQNAYYEDTAAGTGNPQMRMRGVQTGTVTGSEVDQDNAAEVYSVIQESSEKYMKKFYEIIDRLDRAGLRTDSLEGKVYEIDWDFDIKMDKKGKSNKLNLDINTVLTGSQLMTVNQAMEILEFPVIEGEEGDMLLQEWIDMNFPAEVMAPGGEKPEEPGAPETSPGSPEEIAARTRPENVEEGLKEQEERPEKENEFNMIQKLLNQSRDELIENDAVKELFLDNIIPKEVIAKKMVQAGIGSRQINKVLREMYRSGGMAFGIFTAIRNSLATQVTGRGRGL